MQQADTARARELAARYARQHATEEDRHLAKQGDADAQALLAAVHFNELGGERDYGEALRWARLAAAQGNARGQMLLGAAYYGGKGVTRDPAEASRWARLAAEQGDGGGQMLLGALYLNGVGVPQDDASAYMWLLLAGSDSEILPPRRILNLLARRMTRDQVLEAEARACDRDDGRLRRRSPEDEARARELAAKLARQRATDADRRLAEQGDADAQALLAAVYFNGRGVERDYGEALRWARLAAEQENAGGQSVLGMAYRNGNGVARDPAEAARWLRLGAEQGDVTAQTFLGLLYLDGDGVAQDDVSAYLWLTLADAGGQTAGPSRARDRLARRMTPEQLAEAEARLCKWSR